MKRKRSTILMVIVGIFVCIVIVGAASATCFYLSVFDSVDADESVATRAFDEARARLRNGRPLSCSTISGGRSAGARLD
jgi:hypothetical protein